MKKTYFILSLLFLTFISCEEPSEGLTTEQILTSMDWKLESATRLSIGTLDPDDPNYGQIFTFPEILRLSKDFTLAEITEFGEFQDFRDLGTWSIMNDTSIKLGEYEATINKLSSSEWIYLLDYPYKGSVYQFQIKRVPK